MKPQKNYEPITNLFIYKKPNIANQMSICTRNKTTFHYYAKEAKHMYLITRNIYK